MLPVVCRPGVNLSKRADKRSILDPSRIGRIAPGKEGVGMQFGTKPSERTRFHEFCGQLVPLGLRAIAPLDGIRIAQCSRFHNPRRQAFMVCANHRF